jgi:hypothetical protein
MAQQLVVGPGLLLLLEVFEITLRHTTLGKTALDK